MSSIAGKLRRKANAAAVHNNVVEPRTGKVPSVNPSTTHNESFSGVSPCLKKFNRGCISVRLKNRFIIFFIFLLQGASPPQIVFLVSDEVMKY